jgi:hypothetical protein
MGMGGQRHTPTALPRDRDRYRLYWGLGGPHKRSGRVRKISSARGLDCSAFQPTAIFPEVIPSQKYPINKGPILIAKNCPRANSEWVDHAATLHNVAPRATASGTVGVSGYRLLSHTNATWTDTARPPWLSETGKMKDVPEEEVQAKSGRLPKHTRKGASRGAVNGVGKREGTFYEAHWPQTAPTRGMTTPELSVVIQRCARNHVYCWTVNPLTPKGHYSGRTAQLTSRRCILNIYSTNVRSQYFKHTA